MASGNSRRQFAKSLFGWGTLACVSAGSLSGQRLPLQEALAQVFSEKASAQAIGKEYLASTGGNTDRQAMLETLAATLPVELGKEVSIDSLRSLVNRRVREDFRAGKTVSLQGWVVSVTEAQVCAFSTFREGSAV